MKIIGLAFLIFAALPCFAQRCAIDTVFIRSRNELIFLLQAEESVACPEIVFSIYSHENKFSEAIPFEKQHFITLVRSGNIFTEKRKNMHLAIHTRERIYFACGVLK